MLKIVVSQAGAPDREILVQGDVATIGRVSPCDVVIDKPFVSKQHLRIFHGTVALDLGSSNGTLLNGRAVAAPLRIVDGDTINAGSRVLTVRITEGDDEQPSTLVLKSFNAASEIEQARGSARDAAQRVTLQNMPIIKPLQSAHQRCPRCAAPVSELDEECANCKYHWGSFRPMSRTDVRPNPI